MNIRTIFLLFIALTITIKGYPQKGKTPPAENQTAKAAQAPAPASGTEPKPYAQIITKKAVTRTGFLKIHQVEDKYYFEIPDSLLGRDILLVNRIARAAAEVRNGPAGYAGDEIGQNVIRFEKGPLNRLYMIKPMLGERAADTTSGIYQSFKNSNVQPITGAYTVKAYHTDSITHRKSTVIEVTDQLNGDNELFYFSSLIKSQLGLSGQMNDRSNILYVKGFPMNMEIRALKTYGKGSSAATYELNSSMILLPRIPMRSRYYDDRIGYTNNSYTDFDADQQSVKKSSIISRWRLEPKTADIQKYLRGELVEPKKPIIFYIDPATPAKWVPYLIKGITDWEKAFEKAGFKNAIQAKVAPHDTTWSIDDASHSAIVYKASAVLNAFGAEIADPRSGEILESHINWYHNIMTLIHNWYMIQAGAIDPKAGKMVYDDALMGQLIRFVSSHEVGHALGLVHNFGASASVPVDSLRNKKWLERNGHTPSIMDYARFNYVAQPEDHITAAGIFPRVGDYDQWAIEWGYKWYPEKTSSTQEIGLLDKLTVARLKNKRLRFGSELLTDDPRDQNEDLGDNAMTANAYGMQNLKRIVPEILIWTAKPNSNYEDARQVYTELIKQYNQYLWHVAKNIGGRYTTPKTQEQAGVVYENVPAEKQRAAVDFLIKYSFETPLWLGNRQLSELTGMDLVTQLKNSQVMLFSRIFSTSNLSKMIPQGETSESFYDMDTFLKDLKKGAWTELYDHQPINIYRRNLQNAYIEALSSVSRAQKFPLNSLQIWQGLAPSDASVPDISTIARGNLMDLQADIGKALPFAQGITKYHLQDMSYRISNALKDNAKQ